MKITRGNIILTKLEEKIIPYIVLYNSDTQLLDMYCMICGKLFAKGFNKSDLKDIIKEMEIIKIINVIDWIKQLGYTPNPCKTPVKILKNYVKE